MNYLSFLMVRFTNDFITYCLLRIPLQIIPRYSFGEIISYAKISFPVEYSERIMPGHLSIAYFGCLFLGRYVC